jgi:hypothetical protein
MFIIVQLAHSPILTTRQESAEAENVVGPFKVDTFWGGE